MHDLRLSGARVKHCRCVGDDPRGDESVSLAVCQIVLGNVIYVGARLYRGFGAEPKLLAAR